MGSKYPRMAICFLTYGANAARTSYAIRTAQSVCKNLKYPNLSWYIGDDGSEGDHLFAVMAALEDCGAKVFGSHSEKLGAGASWNKANQAALENCDFLMRLEDDWELLEELNPEPYIQLLLNRTDVGMIRLGGLPVDLDLYSVGHSGIHYLRVQSSTHYQWSGNPSIRHRRFVDFYGSFPEGYNPGQTEVEYDAQVRSRPDGPEIWWPLSVGGYGIFGHIGSEQSY